MTKILKVCLLLVCVAIAVYGTAIAQDLPGEEARRQPAKGEVAQETEEEVDPTVAAREATFKEATEAFRKADDFNARLLSPKHYAEAQKSFETAQVIYDRGGNLADIQKELSKSVASLKLATQAAELSQVTKLCGSRANSEFPVTS